MAESDRLLTGSDRLRRGYCRLLWAYPGWYRRERGADLLATLLRMAGPGRVRPSAREAGALVAGGVRCRLRVPRGMPYRLLTGAVVLTAALAGAGLPRVARLFTAAPPEAEAVALAGSVIPLPVTNLPGPAISCGGACGVLEWDEVQAGDEVVTFHALPEDADFVRITYHVPPGRVDAVQVGARAGLAAAGWRVEQPDPAGDPGLFTAARGGRLVTVLTWPEQSTPAGVPLTFDVAKRFGPLAYATVGLGLAVGVFGGWLAMAWALQRYRRQRRLVKAAMLVASSPVLLPSCFLAERSVEFVVAAPFDALAGASLSDLAFLSVMPYFIPQVTVVLVAATLVTLGLAAIPGTTAPPARGRAGPRGGRGGRSRF